MHRFADAHTHAHLCDGGGIIAVQKAIAAGVERIVVCGTQPSDWDAVETLSSSSTPGAVFPQLGLHPYFVSAAGDVHVWAPLLLTRLRALRERFPGVGVGEAGLDRSSHALTTSPWNLQLAAFRAQVSIAAELRMPLTIHCVRAHTVLVDELKQMTTTLPTALLLHSWAGSPRDAASLRSLGIPCVFSFSGGLIAAQKTVRDTAKARDTNSPLPIRLPGTTGKDALASLLALSLHEIAFETDSPDQRFAHYLENHDTSTASEIEGGGDSGHDISASASGCCSSTSSSSVMIVKRDNEPSMLHHVIEAAARLRVGLGTDSSDDVVVTTEIAALTVSSFDAVTRIFFRPQVL